MNSNKWTFRDLFLIVLILTVGILTGVTLALLPSMDSGAVDAAVNFAVIESLPGTAARAGVDAAATIAPGLIVLATMTPAPAPAAFSPEMAEACRQAAVNGRRSSPRCRAYFEWLGVGR